MRDQTTYDENGPLIPVGEVAYSAHTGLPGGPQEFTLPTFMVASDESEVVVSYNGFTLSNFGARNDYYGFGTSPETAFEDAKEALKKLKGCNADIRIITHLTQRPCLPVDETPFYNGAQRVCHVPFTWRSSREDLKEQVQEFVVWENGKATKGAKEFFDVISEMSSKDAAPQRKGDLRTILSRKDPSTRESFMVFPDQGE